MEWKRGVLLKEGCILEKQNYQKQINKEDEYIVRAVWMGITQDEKLLELIMEKEHINEIIAEFRLAQFLLDYGEFIEELKGHRIIEI